MYNLPSPPHLWQNTTVTPDRVSVTCTSSFSQDTSGVFAGIKIRTAKRNTCEAKGKRNTDVSREASVQFKKDKNLGEGWRGGKRKAPTPEANETKSLQGWKRQRRSRTGPRDNFKVTCRHLSLCSLPTGCCLQQIPCHILTASLLLRCLFPTSHGL